MGLFGKSSGHRKLNSNSKHTRDRHEKRRAGDHKARAKPGWVNQKSNRR